MTDTYTCSMHPEETSNEPGRCSKCGMALVHSAEVQLMPKEHHQHESKDSYRPLFVIISLITLAAGVAAAGTDEVFNNFVLYFMTGFFLVFAGFKLIDLKGFAEGYSTYDLLASKWFGYGYIYPFIELAFGLTMLSGRHPNWLLWTEFAVMTFSGLGVVNKLRKHEPFTCACLGTFLKVPLTKVTLIEDFGMAALALVLMALGS